jgi:hypothetical protein
MYSKEERNLILKNSPYKIGDVITDGRQIIEIQQIYPMKYMKRDICLYVGQLLDNLLVPIEGACPKEIYQVNVKRKIK